MSKFWLFVLFLPLFIGEATAGAVTICNRVNERVFATLVVTVNGPPSIFAERSPKALGWYEVESGKCRIVYDQNQYGFSGAYIVVESDSGKTWRSGKNSRVLAWCVSKEINHRWPKIFAFQSTFANCPANSRSVYARHEPLSSSYKLVGSDNSWQNNEINFRMEIR